MDPATLKLIATLGSSLIGNLLPEKKPKLHPAQEALLGAQTRNLGTERLNMEEDRRMAEVKRALETLMLQRRTGQNPMWQALQQMAFKRLPIFAKQGMSMPSFDLPEVGPQQPAGPPAIPRDPRDRRPPLEY